VLVYAVVDGSLSPTFPLGDALEVYVRREDPERFIEEVRGDEPEARGGSADRGAGARGGRAELDRREGRERANRRPCPGLKK
jgi:hypothetical protein